MSFFFLRPWTEPGDAVVDRMSVPEYFENYALGAPLPTEALPAWVDVGSSAHRLTDIMQGPFSFLLVSDRLKAVLAEQQPSQLEFQEVDIRAGRRHIGQCWFVQATANIDAIDWARSDITSSEDDRDYFLSVRKLALDPQKLAGRRVFQVRGLEVDLVVDAETRARIVALDPIGVRLDGLADYRLG